MRKILLLLLGAILLSGPLLAQTRTVTGKVTSSDGSPIPNVTVLIKGTTTGTVTKPDGTYSLTIPSNAKTLVFSSIGMASQETSIGSKTVINISLVTEDKAMDEVVVVGYQTLRKKEVTGAIARISASTIENQPIQSLDRALQGQAAGVSVLAQNGIPGGAVTVRIRGTGSINAGNAPLYIVDGIPIQTSLLTTNVTQTNALAFLNTNDIESIEVLKDAAAASIYGSSAANGVVIVTTKKGRIGRTNITVNAYYGRNSALKYIPVMTTEQFYQARYEGYLYQNITNPNNTPTTARNAALAELGLTPTHPLDSLKFLPSYDWQREAAFRTGTIKNIDLSMSGGNEKTSFYLSGSFNTTEAIIKPVDFRRGTLFTSLKHNVNKKFSVESGINLSTIYQSGPYAGGGGVTTAFGSPSYGASLMVPINPIKNADGTYYGLPGSGQIFRGVFNQNLLATSELDTRWQRTHQLVLNLAVNYEILKGLRYRGVAGLDFRFIQNKYYGDPRNSDWYNRKGYIFQEDQWNTNFVTTHTLNYVTSFGNHNVNVLAGTEFRDDRNEGLTTEGDGFPSFEFRTNNSAANPLSIGGFWTGLKKYSLFGKLNYDFDKRYLATFTLRRDGSSRFGTNKFFGVFPAVSVGWNISSENFLANSKTVSDLKLRLSYGQNGNDNIGNFASRGLYGSGRVYNGASGLTPTQLANPDLTWEVRKEVNVGLDVGLFNNRIVLVFDAYRRINDEILLNRPIYPSTGFTSVSQNLGQVENKGLEFLLNTVNIDGEFKWKTSFNISFERNTIKALYDTLSVLPSAAALRVGQPVTNIFTTRYAGVNPATGRPMWYDINGNITYQPTNADRVNIGSFYPKQYGGLTNTFSYKGFELDVFFNYEYGRVNFDGQYFRLLEIGSRQSNGMKPDYERRWQKPGDVTDVPRPINGATEPRGTAYTSGDRTYMKQDYIRLKQVTLTYNVSKGVLNSLKLNSARFYVQGYNLWTYDDWPGYDPEFDGDSRGLVPQSRNITVGLTVGF